MHKIILTLMLLPVIVSGQLIDPNEMPFGSYSSTWASVESFFTGERLDSMHSSLGFNQHMCGGFKPAVTDSFVSHGIYAYPWTTGNWGERCDPQMMYAHTHRVIAHPESDSSQYYRTRFGTAAGSRDTALVDTYGDTCGYRYYGGSGLILRSMQMSLFNYYSWFDLPFQFKSILKIGIDSSWTDTTDIVGVFTVVRHPSSSITDDTLRFIDTIFVHDLPHGSEFRDTVLILSNDYDSSNTNGYSYFTVLDNDAGKGGWMKFNFETVGNCTVFVDYYEVLDQYAEDLFAGNRDGEIMDSTSRDAYEDKILGWFLKDTENSPNYRPFNYISNLVEAAMDSAGWTNRAYAASWIHFGGAVYHYREFARLAQPKVFWAYIYPIGIETEYTGTAENELQYNFNDLLVRACDTIRAVLADYESTESWLYTPQFWYCDSSEGCPHGEQRRKPTRSEMRCMMYLGLCYHPKGIIFWKYDTHSNSNVGITDVNGYPVPGMYEAVRDDINPYIKAIDSLYLQLRWNAADYISTGQPPTSLNIINNVAGYSHPDSINPDLGWFHIGEYNNPHHATPMEDPPYNKYFMLVNRSCSKDEQGNEAPSVTAVVEINRGAYLNAQQVYVVDIAESVYYDIQAETWVGVPETTYTAITADEKLSYTTTLKAGEGRLYTVLRLII